MQATTGDWEVSATSLTCFERKELHEVGFGVPVPSVTRGAASSRQRSGRAHLARRFRPPHVTPGGREGGERAGSRPVPPPA